MGLPSRGGFLFEDMQYTIDSDYIGRMQITTTAYDHKPTNKECSKMVFTGTTVSLDALSDFITEGYSYCPTDRRMDNVRESDFICIDVDGSDVDMGTFVSCITDTPSIYYTTPSDGDEEYALMKHGDRNRKYRFRLIYALSSPTKNAADYEKGYRYIVAANGLDRIAGFDDVVDFRVANQFYNGSRGCELHNTHRVYSLPDEYRDVITGGEKKGGSPKPKQPAGDREPSACKSGGDPFFGPDVLASFFGMSNRLFLEWYDETYGRPLVLTESEYVQSEEDGRKTVPQGKYYAIQVKKHWDVEKKSYVFEKWRDGEMRHRRIFESGLALKNLNGGITPDVMLYTIVDILLKHYNLKDWDGKTKFTKKYIKGLVKRIMEAEVWDMKELKHSSFRVSDRYCLEHRVSKRKVLGEINGERNTLDKEDRYRDIDWFYNPALKRNDGRKITQQQWVDILNENGIKISKKTFQRYLEERGMVKKRENKKETLTNKNKQHPTFILVDDSFSETEEDVCPSGQDRQFRELMDRIHESDEFRRKWAV